MNKQQGEQTITYMGKEYTARPTFEAMSNIESFLDVGLIDLANKSYTKKLKLKEMCVVLYFAIREGLQLKPNDPMPFDLEELEKHVYSHGMVNYMQPAIELMHTMITGQVVGQDDAKNEQAPTTEKA